MGNLGFWATFVVFGFAGFGLGVGLMVGVVVTRWLRHAMRDEDRA